MPRNIELKARLRDAATARTVAERLCPRAPEIEQQVDTYFDSRRGRLKLREIAGRGAWLISYERPDRRRAKGSDYLLVPVSDPAGLKSAVSQALGITGVVRKLRRIYLFQNVRIHLDEVEGVGHFLEFEAVLAEGVGDANGERQIAELSREFGLDEADLLAGSYGDMLVPLEP
jgi:predicted adenylyl cyclase CyaB